MDIVRMMRIEDRKRARSKKEKKILMCFQFLHSRGKGNESMKERIRGRRKGMKGEISR